MAEAWKTRFDAAVGRITASDTIAIVLPDALGVEIIGSASALASGLRALGKTLSIFAPPAMPGTAAAVWNGYSTEDEPLREFILSFDLTRAPIKELKYERGENRLDIILSPTGSRIRREDIAFRYGDLRYDLVLTLGVPKPDAAEASVRLAPELLHEKPILNIDADPTNVGYGEVNVIPAGIGDPERPTLPELTYELLSSLGAPPIDPPNATALLAALVATTKNFQSTATGAGAFRLAGELVSRGGDLDAASRALPPIRTFGEEQLTGRAIARSRLGAADGLLWAFLNPDDFAKTSSASASVPAVADRIAQSIPYADCVILMWREVVGGPVRCRVVAEDVKRIARITGRRETNADETAITIDEPFESFVEAEGHLAGLLHRDSEVE